ncbi:MAG: hypothetical protein DRG78_10160 [Epsilonproteobacteria bacterium]|nr:MAG: hypothetical protein DRG78_10160 [Campylobacterota bacterium]
MILYIHGFRTTHDSYVATKLKGYFKENLISSDHSHEPHIAIKEFEKIIKKNNIKGIIASSIGGYYATFLSDKYNLKTVLINPSVEPHNTTRIYLGENQKQDGSTFEWKEKHLEYLSTLWIENINPKNFYLFLKKGDEILDYKIAKKRYATSKFLIEDNGDHRFSDIDKYCKKIGFFLKVSPNNS